MRVVAVLLIVLFTACSSAPLPSDRVRRQALLEPPPARVTPPAADAGKPGPAAVPQGRRDRTDLALAAAGGAEVARAAGELVGTRAGSDCSTFVREVFGRFDVDLFSEGAPGDNGVRMIWRLAEARGVIHRRERPDPGDVVFFDDTYDRNRDGRRNDPLTHVGIVERVDDDGTVVFVQRMDRGVVRAHLNLASPGVRTARGRVINDYLRDGGRGPRLSGSLFAGFASLAGG